MNTSLNIKKVATVLRSAGEKSRLAILCMLFKDSNACVSEIALSLKASVASTSHHLRALTGAGLVVPVRRGKNICYKLADTALANDLKKLICLHK